MAASSLEQESSDKPTRQARLHGIFMVQAVIAVLNNADIICCIASVKALRYYGAGRVSTDWQVCVPDSKFQQSVDLFDQPNDKYERGGKILPQLKTLLHTYPRFRPKHGTDSDKVNTFYIVPASEHFLIDLSESMLERSHNGIPYPKLEVFAQSLVSTQRWLELSDLVDGMNLDFAWGETHLELGEPSEAELEYVRWKNEKIMASCEGFPDVRPSAGRLDDPPMDRGRMWRRIMEKREQRIPAHLSRENWVTQYWRKGSVDPRLREDRAV